MQTDILLVDDDPAICDSLVEILEDDGYRVATARNGREALTHLHNSRDDPPGLILLDLMMPIMNGVEFLDVYSADRRLPDVPIVVLSANAGFSGRKHRREILLYLSKPVDVPLLLETIQVWCA